MLKKTIFIITLLFSIIATASFWNSKPELFTNIDNQELQQLLRKGAILVDIRLPEEWRQTGVIKRSKLMTFFTKQGRLDSHFLPRFTKFNKNKPVILICRTGSRTKAASKYIAKQLGFTKVYNVKNGIYGWLKENLPVQRL